MTDKEKEILWYATRALIYSVRMGTFAGKLGYGLVEEFKADADRLTEQFFGGWRPIERKSPK